MTTNTLNAICSACGTSFDETMALEAGGTKSGDLSICGECGHLGILTEEWDLRELTEKELQQVMRSRASHKIRLAQQAIRRKAIGRWAR